MMDQAARDSKRSSAITPGMLTVVALGALIVAALLFVSLIEVDRVVSGRGKTVLQDPRIVLRPLSRSVVKQIHVKVGDKVAKGSAVLTLDPTVSASELNKFLEKVESYEAEVKRFDKLLRAIDSSPMSTRDLAADEKLSSELREFQFKMDKYRAQEAGLREKLAELTVRLPMLSEQLKLASNIEKMWDDLVNKKNYGSQLSLYKASQDRIIAQTQYSEAQGELAKTQHDLQRTLAERDGFAEEWRVGKMESRITAERNLREARQEAAKAGFENSSVVLVAAEDAVVTEMSDTAVGTVVTPNDVLMKLVPAKTPDLIDVRVAATDVSMVSPGMPVEIKLDSAPFQKHGFLHGTLEAVTYDSFDVEAKPSAGGNDISSNVSNISADAKQFYLARIRVTSNALKNLPDAFRLVPGMSVEADIKVGRRRLLEYLLFPVMRVVNDGMREP